MAEAASSSSPPPRQIKIQLVAVGNAPILKKTKFQVRDTMRIGEVVLFIRKLTASDSTTTATPPPPPLFVYINSSFAPSPDQPLGALFDSFAVNNELMIQFAITNTWG